MGDNCSLSASTSSAGDGEHQGARRGGQRLDVGTGAQVGLGVHRADRHAGVGGGAECRAARPGTTSNGHDGAGDGERFLDRVVVGERVAGDEADDLLAGAGGREHTLAASAGEPAAGCTSVGRARADRLGHRGIGDDEVRRAQGLDRPSGEQGRVTRAGTDEGDTADGLACSGHAELPISV